jgi:colanic acid/amylovoran biosynthesis glycosyltransferase
VNLAARAIGGAVPKIGYVLKMYPRFSETFIVNEILEHEDAGLSLEIFSLRMPVDGRFHEMLADVRAPVHYLTPDGHKTRDAWAQLRLAHTALPGFGRALESLLAAEAEDALQAIALAEAVRARGITHLHAHFGSVATTVARLASLLTGVPYTFTAHAKDIFHAQVDEPDLRRKLRDAASVITVSDFNLRYLRERYGSDAGGVERVYNGLDLRRFPYRPPGDRPPVVVGVGRLVEKKGFDTLIRACALLAERQPLRCLIVGAGPEEGPLRDLVRTLGCQEHVELAGPMPQRRVIESVAGAAALAAPCVVGADGNRDGLPTVLLEAMALGTPCVATPVTGIPEVIRDGQTGLLVPERDPEALATALGRLGDGELRCGLAGRARALVEAEFDITRQAGQLRAHFSPAVGSRAEATA